MGGAQAQAQAYPLHCLALKAVLKTNPIDYKTKGVSRSEAGKRKEETWNSIYNLRLLEFGLSAQ